MRHYIDRFKRGYEWEKRDGATDPRGRFFFSAAFAAICFMFAKSAAGVTIATVVAVGLMLLWVGVTINGSKWADAQESQES